MLTAASEAARHSALRALLTTKLGAVSLGLYRLVIGTRPKIKKQIDISAHNALMFSVDPPRQRHSRATKIEHSMLAGGAAAAVTAGRAAALQCGRGSCHATARPRRGHTAAKMWRCGKMRQKVGLHSN